MLIHATCIALYNKAVLLAGEPGSGKSDVGLRMVDEGAQLVADDQTLLAFKNGHLVASAPASIAGLMEIRHVGLVRMPVLADAPVALYVELVPTNHLIERLPEKDVVFLLDQPVRHLRLHAYAASTPAKIRAALSYPVVTDELNFND